MKKNLILMSCLLWIAGNAFAQEPEQDWQKTPAAHQVNAKYKNESAVMLEDNRTYEYRQDEKNNMWMYQQIRKIVKLNDDKGVEMFNKIYIYVPSSATVETIKARALQPNGSVVNLPQDKIFDVEEEGKKYKKFALEGIEKGSEIEYYVRFKQDVSTFGLEIFQSSTTPCEKASFTIAYPEHLVFAVKGYNGFKVTPEQTINKRKIIRATEENIDAVDDEKYASKTPYFKNVQFKLAYNLDKNKNVEMYTWNELAKNVYANYHNFSPAESKALVSLAKKIDLPASSTEEDRIIRVEDYLKTNFNIDENASNEEADIIDKIAKSKVASEYGFKRIMIGVLDQLDIKNQIVFPSKRDDFPIDESFQNYRLIDNFLLYFPGTGNFIDPLNVTFRYPFVEPYAAGTHGLFLQGTTIGDFKTALASFDTIPLVPYERNSTNLFVDLGFNQEMDSVWLKTRQSITGYAATYYRPAYNFLQKDKQDEFTRDVIKSISNSNSISNIKVENTALTDAGKSLPLNIMAEINSAELIERAGNKYLLKIGEVIGQQEQMYQEKKRQLPVLIQYPHALDRVIRFTVPKGYAIKNLDDIKKNVTDNRQSMGFISGYDLKGNELTINLHEFYKETSYPLSEYEEYRKVVNASADFNKVVLVLEKTK